MIRATVRNDHKTENYQQGKNEIPNQLPQQKANCRVKRHQIYKHIQSILLLDRDYREDTGKNILEQLIHNSKQ